ncbi:MAG: response regulator transcription factor [Chloroflexi bacterium]|nr:response regulator transcription factor [Chloroflexota bacterium]
MVEPIRLIIADDHPLFLEGIVQSLSSQPDMSIVGQASNGEEAYEFVAKDLPDVVLLDITMPGQGGIETARKISAAYPIVQIIMLTVSEDEDDLMAALKAGARGYILKGVSARELANAVRTVANGETYISALLASNLLVELSHSDQPDPLSELTIREKEILELVAEGLTNIEIGERLHLAEKTVKHYMTNVMQKLHVRSRVEAALLVHKKKRDDG